jgi:hypothetical protein
MPLATPDRALSASRRAPSAPDLWNPPFGGGVAPREAGEPRRIVRLSPRGVRQPPRTCGTRLSAMKSRFPGWRSHAGSVSRQSPGMPPVPKLWLPVFRRGRLASRGGPSLPKSPDRRHCELRRGWHLPFRTSLSGEEWRPTPPAPPADRRRSSRPPRCPRPPRPRRIFCAGRAGSRRRASPALSRSAGRARRRAGGRSNP